MSNMENVTGCLATSAGGAAGVQYDFAHPDSVPTLVGDTARAGNAADVALTRLNQGEQRASRSRRRTRGRRSSNDSVPTVVGDTARAGHAADVALTNQEVNQGELARSRPRTRGRRNSIDSNTSLDSENPRRRRPRRHVSFLKEEVVPQNENTTVTTLRATPDFRCMCGGAHTLVQCTRFRSLPLHRRLRKVIAAGLCTNCFAQTHKLAQCTSKYRCQECGEQHHTMLHDRSRSVVARVPLGRISRVPNLHANRPLQLTSHTSRASMMPLTANGQLVLVPTARCSIIYGSR